MHVHTPHLEIQKTADRLFAMGQLERERRPNCLAFELVRRADELIPFPHGPALTLYRARCLLPCQ